MGVMSRIKESASHVKKNAYRVMGIDAKPKIKAQSSEDERKKPLWKNWFTMPPLLKICLQRARQSIGLMSLISKTPTRRRKTFLFGASKSDGVSRRW